MCPTGAHRIVIRITLAHAGWPSVRPFWATAVSHDAVGCRLSAAVASRTFFSKGVRMTRKLNKTDRAAVDMLFDRLNAGHSDGNGGTSYLPLTAAVDEKRLAAVE